MFIQLMRYVVIEGNWTQYVIIRHSRGIFVYLVEDYLRISILCFVLVSLFNWLNVFIKSNLATLYAIFMLCF